MRQTMSRLPLLLLFFLLVSVLQGCVSRQRALSATLVAVDTARIGFVTWDDSHQQEIVEKAADSDEAAAALEDYRQRRTSVLLGFELAYQAIARAALDDDVSLAQTNSVVDNLKKLILGLAGSSFLE